MVENCSSVMSDSDQNTLLVFKEQVVEHRKELFELYGRKLQIYQQASQLNLGSELMNEVRNLLKSNPFGT